jgi:hypothetical protein
MTVVRPEPSSCSLDDFFNQAELPHDVREAEHQAWRVRNKRRHAENVKKHTESGLLASLLRRDDFFNARNRETGMRIPVPASEWLRRIDLAYPSEARALSLLNPEGSQRGGGVGVEQGLSNSPYWADSRASNSEHWAASYSAELIEMTISQASALVRVRKVRGPQEYDLGAGRSDKRISKRSTISEFSRRSRLNLQLKAAELKESVKAPDWLITLTYPGDWRRVCVDECICGAAEGSSDVMFDIHLDDAPILSRDCICPASGEIVKNEHLKALRKRMTRFLKKLGVEPSSWGALWFFEFQTRGAPHVHILPWGVSDVDLELLKPYLSRSWADIVAHPDSHEYEKHLSAGTGVEKYRNEHFGYALKYAAKMEQKTVPNGWGSVGRFWGVWNDPCKAPVLRSLYAMPSNLKKLSDGLAERVAAYSEVFAERLMNVFMTEKTFSVRVFGVEASRFLLSYGLPSG